MEMLVSFQSMPQIHYFLCRNASPWSIESKTKDLFGSVARLFVVPGHHQSAHHARRLRHCGSATWRENLKNTPQTGGQQNAWELD